jgi:hypothetical protein
MAYGFQGLYTTPQLSVPGLGLPYDMMPPNMLQTGQPFGYGTTPGNMVGQGLGAVGGGIGGTALGGALGAVGNAFLPGLGGALGASVGGMIGNTLMGFFEDEPEELAQAPMPVPDVDYLQTDNFYEAPPLPPNLSQRYGVQNPYGFRQV